MQSPNLICILRAKNEETKIRRCLDAMPFVDKFVIVDNGSTDDTIAIVGEYPSIVLHTQGVDAARDLNLAYQEALRQGATYVTWLDADEEWETRAAEELPKLLEQELIQGWIFRIYPFVLSREYYRVDRDWLQFTLQGQLRLFRAQEGVHWDSLQPTHPGPPRNLQGAIGKSDLRIKHWTIETEEELQGKIAFYSSNDGKDYGHLLDGPKAVYKKWHGH